MIITRALCPNCGAGLWGDKYSQLKDSNFSEVILKETCCPNCEYCNFIKNPEYLHDWTSMLYNEEIFRRPYE